ncbi:sulfite exporter TauE/SafE family protein [Aquibium sp. LZ166]|uniref:Probable membrane transporter protein n=1 Tax=Aquibium pacificus TaxID=3153579 RepID=A0ABV3SG53_9HYPH
MFETMTLQAAAVALAAFLCGGFIKGLTGIGLPMVALPILSLVFTIPEAVGLTMVPILVSNGWQALTSGAFLPVVRRFWPMQLTMAVAIVFSSSFMVRLDDQQLLFWAGMALALSAVGLRLRGTFQVPARLERVTGVAVGLFAGMVGGVSSLFGIPIIVYMMSIGLSKAEFISSISIIYLFAGIPFLFGLLYFGAVAPGDLVFSAMAVVPVMVGLTAARLVLRGVDDKLFHKLLLALLMFLGASMMYRGI